MTIMFTIKICGISRPEDALAVAHAGGDAIGLNFYPTSPRAIDLGRASDILATLPAGIIKVGLFVNAEAAEIRQTYDALGLDLIQLHGDEPPEYLALLGGRPVMKAFRASGAEGLRSIADYLSACRALGRLPRLILLDAPLASGFGGSGKLADWELARKYRENFGTPEMVLAGGLKPENVAEAVLATGLRAVDTASGVELRPGIKDASKVAEFVKRVKDCR
jgi:phosphoribosylanthranilate isomerase